MLTTPFVEHRDARTYAACETWVKPQEIPGKLQLLLKDVYAWLAEQQVASSHPPFFHYLAMKNGELLVRVGVEIPANARLGDQRVGIFEFPAANYAVVTYFGDYRNMMQAHMSLEKWVKDSGLKEETSSTPDGCTWGGRTEFYKNDWTRIPDPEKWETEIVFLLKD